MFGETKKQKIMADVQISYGSSTTSGYCTSSLSCCPLDSCCFKESPLPQPHANRVFEHAGMWRSIVRPIVWAHKGGLCAWKSRLAKIQRGQAYAISEAQWEVTMTARVLSGPSVCSVCPTGTQSPEKRLYDWRNDSVALASHTRIFFFFFLSDRWPQRKRPKRKQQLLMLPRIRWI